MKGIVVEINKKGAVILTEDGLFEAIKNRNYEVGQDISVTETRKPISRFAAMAASAAAVLVLTTSAGFAYYTPTDYVSIDVNPSIEYSVNLFDRILDVKAVNDDGEKILKDLDLTNQKLEKALLETIDKLIEDGYLTDDPDGGILITTSNKKISDAEELAGHLKKDIQKYLNQHENITAKVKAEAVGKERVEEAKKLGVTPGKLNLVEKLQNSTTGAINVDDWLSKPVKDIVKAIKENNTQHHEIIKEQAPPPVIKEQAPAAQKNSRTVSADKGSVKKVNDKASAEANLKKNDDKDRWENKKKCSKNWNGNWDQDQDDNWNQDENNRWRQAPKDWEKPQDGTGRKDDRNENHRDGPPGHDKRGHSHGNCEPWDEHSEDKPKEDRSNGNSNRGSCGSND